jgi:hypothetical protein
MMTPEKEQEYREEAERLAQLTRDDQKSIIALHRSIASNPKVPKAERQAGRERADALERYLNRLARRKKSEGKSQTDS